VYHLARLGRLAKMSPHLKTFGIITVRKTWAERELGPVLADQDDQFGVLGEDVAPLEDLRHHHRKEDLGGEGAGTSAA